MKLTVKEMSFDTLVVPVTLKNINDPIDLVCFGDVHRHSPTCAVDKWLEFCEEWKTRQTRNTLYLGLGDYDEWMSLSERHKYAQAGFHDSTCKMIEDVATSQVEELAREMSFMKGHLIGLLPGNHQFVFPNGVSSVDALAAALGASGLSLSGLMYIQLDITFKDTGEKSEVNLVAHHGIAGGRTAGNTFNQVNRLREVMPYADAYIMGHDHQGGVKPECTLDMIENEDGELIPFAKEQRLCRSMCFTKSYERKVPVYTVPSILKPTSIGALEGVIRFKKHNHDGLNVILPRVRFLV